MTKTPEQIREEAERRYPKKEGDEYTLEEFTNSEINFIKMLSFAEGANWLQSEQGATPPQGGHELDLQYPTIKGETTDPTAKTFLTKENIEGFSAIMPTTDTWVISQEHAEQIRETGIVTPTPTPPQGEEEMNASKWAKSMEGCDLDDYQLAFISYIKGRDDTEAARQISTLTAELTALRSQLSEAQENYEKVWDAAEAAKSMAAHIVYEANDVHWIEYHSTKAEKQTFINNLNNQSK
jgi:hypothetical protein